MRDERKEREIVRETKGTDCPCTKRARAVASFHSETLNSYFPSRSPFPSLVFFVFSFLPSSSFLEISLRNLFSSVSLGAIDVDGQLEPGKTLSNTARLMPFYLCTDFFFLVSFVVLSNRRESRFALFILCADFS